MSSSAAIFSSMYVLAVNVNESLYIIYPMDWLCALFSSRAARRLWKHETMKNARSSQRASAIHIFASDVMACIMHV